MEEARSVVPQQKPRLTQQQKGQLSHLQALTDSNGELCFGSTSSVNKPAQSRKVSDRSARRQGILRQIDLVRRIRQDLESSNQRALEIPVVRKRQKAARTALYAARADVLRLCAVTDALQGNYQLPSYDQYVNHFDALVDESEPYEESEEEEIEPPPREQEAERPQRPLESEPNDDAPFHAPDSPLVPAATTVEKTKNQAKEESPVDEAPMDVDVDETLLEKIDGKLSDTKTSTSEMDNKRPAKKDPSRKNQTKDGTPSSSSSSLRVPPRKVGTEDSTKQSSSPSAMSWSYGMDVENMSVLTRRMLQNSNENIALLPEGGTTESKADNTKTRQSTHLGKPETEQNPKEPPDGAIDSKSRRTNTDNIPTSSSHINQNSTPPAQTVALSTESKSPESKSEAESMREKAATDSNEIVIIVDDCSESRFAEKTATGSPEDSEPQANESADSALEMTKLEGTRTEESGPKASDSSKVVSSELKEAGGLVSGSKASGSQPTTAGTNTLEESATGLAKKEGTSSASKPSGSQPVAPSTSKPSESLPTTMHGDTLEESATELKGKEVAPSASEPSGSPQITSGTDISSKKLAADVGESVVEKRVSALNSKDIANGSMSSKRSSSDGLVPLMLSESVAVNSAEADMNVSFQFGPTGTAMSTSLSQDSRDETVPRENLAGSTFDDNKRPQVVSEHGIEGNDTPKISCDEESIHLKSQQVHSVAFNGSTCPENTTTVTKSPADPEKTNIQQARGESVETTADVTVAQDRTIDDLSDSKELKSESTIVEAPSEEIQDRSMALSSQSSGSERKSGLSEPEDRTIEKRARESATTSEVGDSVQNLLCSTTSQQDSVAHTNVKMPSDVSQIGHPPRQIADGKPAEPTSCLESKNASFATNEASAPPASPCSQDSKKAESSSARPLEAEVETETVPENQDENDKKNEVAENAAVVSTVNVPHAESEDSVIKAMGSKEPNVDIQVTAASVAKEATDGEDTKTRSGTGTELLEKSEVKASEALKAATQRESKMTQKGENEAKSNYDQGSLPPAESVDMQSRLQGSENNEFISPTGISTSNVEKIANVKQSNDLEWHTSSSAGEKPIIADPSIPMNGHTTSDSQELVSGNQVSSDVQKSQSGITATGPKASTQTDLKDEGVGRPLKAVCAKVEQMEKGGALLQTVQNASRHESQDNLTGSASPMDIDDKPGSQPSTTHEVQDEAAHGAGEGPCMTSAGTSRDMTDENKLESARGSTDEPLQTVGEIVKNMDGEEVDGAKEFRKGETVKGISNNESKLSCPKDNAKTAHAMDSPTPKADFISGVEEGERKSADDKDAATDNLQSCNAFMAEVSAKQVESTQGKATDAMTMAIRTQSSDSPTTEVSGKQAETAQGEATDAITMRDKAQSSDTPTTEVSEEHTETVEDEAIDAGTDKTQSSDVRTKGSPRKEAEMMHEEPKDAETVKSQSSDKSKTELSKELAENAHGKEKDARDNTQLRDALVKETMKIRADSCDVTTINDRQAESTKGESEEIGDSVSTRTLEEKTSAGAEARSSEDASSLETPSLTWDEVHREILLHDGRMKPRRLMKIFNVKKTSSAERRETLRKLVRQLCTVEKDAETGNVLVLKPEWLKPKMKEPPTSDIDSLVSTTQDDQKEKISTGQTIEGNDDGAAQEIEQRKFVPSAGNLQNDESQDEERLGRKRKLESNDEIQEDAKADYKEVCKEKKRKSKDETDDNETKRARLAKEDDIKVNEREGEASQDGTALESVPLEHEKLDHAMLTQVASSAHPTHEGEKISQLHIFEPLPARSKKPKSYHIVHTV